MANHHRKLPNAGRNKTWQTIDKTALGAADTQQAEEMSRRQSTRHITITVASHEELKERAGRSTAMERTIQQQQKALDKFKKDNEHFKTTTNEMKHQILAH